jgi:type IV pilus assembly protein PilB
MTQKKKIGEILVESGLITGEQLSNALIMQKGKNKRIGKILIEMGFVNEIQVAETLSKQLSLDLVDCSNYRPSRKLLSAIPKETAEQKVVFPLEIQNNKLFVAMANPLDWQAADDISFNSGFRVKIAVSSESSILSAIEKSYGSSDDTWSILQEMPSYEEAEFVKEEETNESSSINVQALFKESEAPPIVRLVTMLIADAVNDKASDIHVEPRENSVKVRYRIDGELRTIHNYPKKIHDSVISRIKIISNLDITNRRFPQDGRSTLRIKNRNVDLRISTLPSLYGEKIVIRLLDPTSGLIPLGQLGISDYVMKPLLEIIRQPQGMLLITGPTGSGKTTTLYSALQQVISDTKNIITIEDPIEYKIADITQVGINEPIGYTFARALRSVLRQDPDIIMVGEIRDLDTAEIAARSALTGHLVLSTLHTNDTVASITRMVDIGLAPYLVSAAVSGILAQRLVRKICPACKVKVEPPEEIKALDLPPLKEYYKGKGCSKCKDTGYSGRIGVYELLHMSTELKREISKGSSEEVLWQVALETDIKPLFEDAWLKVKQGITTVDEVLLRIPYTLSLLRNKESGKPSKETPVLKGA